MNTKRIPFLGHRTLSWTAWRSQGGLALLVAALLLSACTWPSQPPPTPAPGETELPFESIDRGNTVRPYPKTQPAVAVVTSRQEIEERLDQMASNRALQQLQSIDFGQYFVVAVFRGTKPMGGYSVTIRRVGRRGKRLVVYAELSETPPNFPKAPAAVSPYHLVKVQRDGRPLEPQDVILLTWLTYIR